MPNQALSKESEKRMLDALEKAAALIADGAHPNEALIKVAEDAKVPAGHVHLMVNAINTGRTNSQRLLHENPLDKAGEFPMADAATVLDALYPAKIRTKAASYLTSAVSSEYKSPPRFMAQNARAKTANAAINWKLTDKKPEVQTDPDLPMKRAMSQVRRLEIDVEEKRRKVAEVREEALKLAYSLREYFKQPGHISYPEVAENARLLFGKQAESVLRTVTPSKLEKQSHVTTPVNTDKAPYSLIIRALNLAQTYQTSQEAYKAAAQTAQNESVALLTPFAPAGLSAGHSVMAHLSSLSKAAADKKEDKSKSYADIPGNLDKGFGYGRSIIGGGLGLMGKAIGSGFGVLPMGDTAKAIGQRVGGLPRDEGKQEMLSDLMDPSHEMEIRNIQSEALLNDLMANDDVIKGHSPDDVIDAYNEISQIAPYAADKKVIMRDLLRKRLSGGGAALDQFVVGDTLDSQSKLKEQHTIPETNLTTMKDMGVLPGVTQTHTKSVLAK